MTNLDHIRTYLTAMAFTPLSVVWWSAVRVIEHQPDGVKEWWA